MENVLVSAITTVDKKVHDKLVNEEAQKQTVIDDIFKWAPAALLMAYDAKGFKARNNYKIHLLQIFVGELMLNAAIRPLKKSVNRIRPNGKLKSFPSAHTATALLSSSILYEELKQNSPALKHSGYAVALFTGWLRLYRKKHWFSDVVGGAIFGAFFGKIAAKLIGNNTE